MKQFTKRIEDFTCAHCGAVVHGNGYTNHCPNCLWSKHVDNNPGDRASDCGGMMEPVGLEIKGHNYYITHKCTCCGKTIRQKASPDDNMETLIALSTISSFIYGGRSLTK